MGPQFLDERMSFLKTCRRAVFLLMGGALVLMVVAGGWTSESDELPVYSPSSLVEFDGLNGQPAYVAIEGYVYDVSGVFADGTHGGYEAGREWTEEMAESGHGFAPLENLEPVGVFVALELTLEELAEYTGRGDNPAYVAVAGYIYDVSDSGRWRGGMHNGFRAGHDLTEEINNASPHGLRVLANLPLVGVLVEE